MILLRGNFANHFFSFGIFHSDSLHFGVYWDQVYICLLGFGPDLMEGLSVEELGVSW